MKSSASAGADAIELGQLSPSVLSTLESLELEDGSERSRQSSVV